METKCICADSSHFQIHFIASSEISIAYDWGFCASVIWFCIKGQLDPNVSMKWSIIFKGWYVLDVSTLPWTYQSSRIKTPHYSKTSGSKYPLMKYHILQEWNPLFKTAFQDPDWFSSLSTSKESSDLLKH